MVSTVWTHKNKLTQAHRKRISLVSFLNVCNKEPLFLDILLSCCGFLRDWTLWAEPWVQCTTVITRKWASAANWSAAINPQHKHVIQLALAQRVPLSDKPSTYYLHPPTVEDQILGLLLWVVYAKHANKLHNMS